MEILPGPRSSRAHSPSHAYRSDYSHGQPSDSSTWRPSTNRFQPRYSPVTAYDRLINNSQFNQPLQGRFPSHLYDDTSVRHPQQRMNEPSPSYFSRSNDDLLNSSMDTSRPKPTRDYRAESDFLQPNKYASRLRRSYDALNDYPDSYQSFPTRRPQASFEHQQQQQPTYRSTYTTHMNDNTVPSSHQKPHHPCKYMSHHLLPLSHTRTAVDDMSKGQARRGHIESGYSFVSLICVVCVRRTEEEKEKNESMSMRQPQNSKRKRRRAIRRKKN